MRKPALIFTVITFFCIFSACKKSDSDNSNARTVQNFSGSYRITALVAALSGVTVNLYDSLESCQKDNLITLSTDMTAAFVDAGVTCNPSADSTGLWSLSQNTDTIYVAGSPSYIKSWDGKTLILTNAEEVSGFAVVATTTLVKQ